MGKVKGSKTNLRRSNVNPFERKCACTIHDPTLEYHRLYSTTSKDYKKSDLKRLIDNKLISKKAKNVCNICLNFGRSCSTSEDRHEVDQEDKTDSSSDEPLVEDANANNDNDNFDFINKTVHALNVGKVSESDIQKLCLSLGRYFHLLVSNDIKDTSGIYRRNFDNLRNFQPYEFLLARPRCLVLLIGAIVGLDLEANKCNNIDLKKITSLCFVLEQLYNLRNKTFIGSLSFCVSLIKWSLTGSKLCHNIDSTLSAAGSITTMKNILKEWSSAPNTCFQENDIDIFFDNTQKIGKKTRRVREGGSTPVDIATNVIFIQSSNPTNIQSRYDLKPSLWQLPSTADVLKLHSESIQVFECYKRNSQKDFLEQVLSTSLFEKESMETKDDVSYFMVEENRGNCICTKCKEIYVNSIQKCPKCGNNPNTINDRQSMYSGVPSKHAYEPPRVKLGEIIGVNPNGSQTVKEVLINLLNPCNIGTLRQWVRVGCDGVPYSIADKLIHECLVNCDVCEEQVSLSDIETHFTNNHSGYKIQYHKLFDSILLVPGTGHTEINLIRSLFQLCRNVFMELLAEKLGFCSKRAIDYIVSGRNHHLSWQVVVIILHSFALELLRIYVQWCYENTHEPSIAHYIQWRGNVINPNYNFYYDLVFNMFLGIKCFRCGVRKNNSKYMLAGRQIASPVFFVGKHRIYQILIIRDLQLRVTAPVEVLDYITENESYSVSGDETKGEGGDYIMEHYNRVLKQHLPPGVPTVSDWKTSSRCDGPLKDIRESVFRQLNIKDPSESEASHALSQEREIQMFRSVIRQSRVLEYPFESMPLKSLSGRELHYDLVNFMSTCTNNFENSVENGKDADLLPLFVTYEDEEKFNDVKNWTNKKIIDETDKLISEFFDQELQTAYKDLLKGMCRSNKNVLVQFYEEVYVIHTAQSNSISDIAEDDDCVSDL